MFFGGEERFRWLFFLKGTKEGGNQLRVRVLSDVHALQLLPANKLHNANVFLSLDSSPPLFKSTDGWTVLVRGSSVGFYVLLKFKERKKERKKCLVNLRTNEAPPFPRDLRPERQKNKKKSTPPLCLANG